MTKEEFLNIADNYKSRDFVKFNCAHCGKESSRIKKSLLRSIQVVDFICCSSACSEKILNPRLEIPCKYCGKSVTRLKSKVTDSVFCSSSCAATYNNKNRERSVETRLKTSESLRDYYASLGFSRNEDKVKGKFVHSCVACCRVFTSASSKSKYCSKSCSDIRKRKPTTQDGKVPSKHFQQFCKISFHDCINCGNKILHSFHKNKNKRKTCSQECRTLHVSRIQSERLSKTENRCNMGRHKKSYLEASFEDWLRQRKIPFETEVHYRNVELNKSYYVDFLFRDKNLVIELDGTQHRKTVEKDRVRDEFLTREHNLTVIRITHKEYREKSRLSEICFLLEVPLLDSLEIEEKE